MLTVAAKKWLPHSNGQVDKINFRETLLLKIIT